MFRCSAPARRLWPGRQVLSTFGIAAALLAAGRPAVAPPAAAAAAATAPAGCAATFPRRTHPPILALDPRPRAPRVFAVQFKQSGAAVASYASFRTRIDCLLRADVLPYLARGRPNVVVFGEDVGLATVATGSRGAVARGLFAKPGGPSCEAQGEPCGTLGALASLTAAYAPQLAAYSARFGPQTALGQAFLGATDTTVRSFMGTFSALALRYGIYLIGSADVPDFTQSTSLADRLAFADPDLGGLPPSVYVATGPEIHNTVAMWGPRRTRTGGPDVLRNLVASNEKVPLTPIELLLGLTAGPATGPAAVDNLRPVALPGTGARLGFATSLPAFVYGTPPAGVDPCRDTSRYYMRCLDRLGANLVIQDEANPGRWTGPDGDGVERWQPLSWMTSTYRTVSDPTVRFAYNVTAMMVGNLADLAFDGQSAITERGLGFDPAARRPLRSARRCAYLGDRGFLPAEDESGLRGYAGRRSGFLALAPWVVPDAGRDRLRAVGAALAPGSGSPLEDDYLETALVADLPFPVDRRRPGCAGA